MALTVDQAVGRRESALRDCGRFRYLNGPSHEQWILLPPAFSQFFSALVCFVVHVVVDAWLRAPASR